MFLLRLKIQTWSPHISNIIGCNNTKFKKINKLALSTPNHPNDVSTSLSSGFQEYGSHTQPALALPSG